MQHMLLIVMSSCYLGIVFDKLRVVRLPKAIVGVLGMAGAVLAIYDKVPKQRS